MRPPNSPRPRHEPKIAKIEYIHKNVDDPNGIVLIDPVLQAFRE